VSVLGSASCSGAGEYSCNIGAVSVMGDASCYSADATMCGPGAVSVFGDATCGGTCFYDTGAISVAGHAYCSREYDVRQATTLGNCYSGADTVAQLRSLAS
jgi:hypothetical protein